MKEPVGFKWLKIGGSVSGCHEHGNEPLVSIEGKQLINWLNNCQHLKGNSMDFGYKIILIHCSQQPTRLVCPSECQIRLVHTTTSPTLLCCSAV